MPNDNNFEAKHVIVPVYHSGDDAIHNIAVPADVPVSDLHKSLVDAGYGNAPSDVLPDSRPSGASRDWSPYQGAGVDSFGRPKAGPSKQGVVENSPAFKQAAKDVWKAAGYGLKPTESGTYLDKDQTRGPIVSSDTEGHMVLQVPDDAESTLHSHPDHFHGQAAGGQPSDTDINTAVNKLKRNVYVVSKSGLQVVDKFGKTTSVYSDPNWFDHDNK